VNRGFFLACAASAISIGRPLLAKADVLAKHVQDGTIAQAATWRNAAWNCGSAVVWLDSDSGVYYRKGERQYGRTSRGAYTCEDKAIDAGNRASSQTPA
jgi:hypothetical protein